MQASRSRGNAILFLNALLILLLLAHDPGIHTPENRVRSPRDPGEHHTMISNNICLPVFTYLRSLRLLFIIITGIYLLLFTLCV